MFLADHAVPLFVLAALGQAAYFAYLAPAYFDRVEPPDAAGRRASLNAFVLYLAATALVVWASYTGRLQPWSQITWLGQVLILAALLANIVSVVRVIWFPAHSGGSEFDDGSDDAHAREPLPASGSKSFKLMGEYQAHPLWALDDGLYGDVAPAELALSQQQRTTSMHGLRRTPRRSIPTIPRPAAGARPSRSLTLRRRGRSLCAWRRSAPTWRSICLTAPCRWCG